MNNNNNIIGEVALDNSRVDISLVNLEMSMLTGDHVPLQINTALIPKCYKTVLISNDVNDDKGLAKLLVSEKNRAFLIKVIADETKLSQILAIACVTKNDSVRLNTPISDYYLVSKAVNEVYGKEGGASITEKTVLSILLYRAMLKWQMIAQDRRVATVLHEKAENIGESVLRSEVMLDQALRIVTSINFRTVSGEKGYTNIKVLAALFADSMASVVPQLENLNRFQSAFQSVLARVYAFVTKRVAENYAPEERFFIERPNFLFLASNISIIRMAVDNTMLRPLSNAMFWDEQDAIIYDALLNNSLFEVVNLPKYRERFAMTRLVSSRGTLSGVIVSKLIENNDNYETYYKMEFDKLAEFAPFSLTQEHDSLLTSLLKTFKSDGAHIMASSLMESIISDDISKIIMTLGLNNEQELDNLAAAFADRVLIDTKSNLLTFTKTLEKNQSNLQFCDFFPEYITTENAKTLLLAIAHDYIGKDRFVSEVGYKPMIKTKYSNAHIIVSNTLKSEVNLELLYSYDYQSDTVKTWNVTTSFNDLLKLDITTPIVTSRIELLSASLRKFINLSRLFNEKKFLLAGITAHAESEVKYEDMGDAERAMMKQIEKISSSVNYVVQVRSCAFVESLIKLATDNSYFKMINHNLLSQFVSAVRSHPKKFADIKSGNIYADELLKQLFTYGTVNALLLLSGVYNYQDGEADYEYMNKLLARRCLLNNM